MIAVRILDPTSSLDQFPWRRARKYRKLPDDAPAGAHPVLKVRD